MKRDNLVLIGGVLIIVGLLLTSTKSHPSKEPAIIQTATSTPQLHVQETAEQQSKESVSAVTYQNCDAFSENYDVCLTSIGPGDDYWGTKTTTEFNLRDKTTKESTLLYSWTGFAPTYLGKNDSKVFYYMEGYEGNGPGIVFSLDVNSKEYAKIDMDAYGEISPDRKFYVSTSDTANKDGAQFCNNPIEQSNTISASAIKLLNFASGQISTLLEDKNSAYLIDSWSSTSDAITYTKYPILGG
jgi:hypothetical protein